jgi:hypothetical protein
MYTQKTNQNLLNKKKFTFLFVVLTTVFVSCRDNGKTTSTAKGDTEFQQLSEEFIAGYLAWRPEFSVFWGFHDPYLFKIL